MALDILANYIEATVTTGGTTAPVTGTVEAWTVTTTENWPVLATGQQLRVMDKAQLVSTSGYEIMLATVTANGTGVSWTVTRGVEGTTPVAHSASWTVVPATTSGAFNNFGFIPGSGALFPIGIFSGTFATGIGVLVAGSVHIPGGSVNGVAFCIDTGSAGTVRLGLYDMATGVPTNLIVDAGAVAATGSYNIVTFSGIVLPAGVYAVALASLGASTSYDCVQNNSAVTVPPPQLASSLTTAQIRGAGTGWQSGTAVTSVLPSTFGVATWYNNIPWMAVVM